VTDATRDWLASLEVPGRPDEHDTKRLLAGFGLAVPAAQRIRARISEAQSFEAPCFDGPYVVKVRSPDILHKTDGGGVRLGVDLSGLQSAVDNMLFRFPGRGVLVEEQVTFAGPEFIVGAFRDSAFGPTVMAGAGGILTELYRDVAFRLVPCSRAEALRMLKELAVFPALEGFRGLVMDPAGLAALVAQVSAIVEDLGDSFSQLDINPLVFAPRGWTVLDAKLILAPEAPTQRPEAPRRG
jgi:hypothetical protein